MPSYHVTYRESKKVITVSDKSEIVRHIKDIFGIQALVKDIQLQLYDVEWEDFVDVECDVLPERGKLNVYVRRNERKQHLCACLTHQSLLHCLAGSFAVVGNSLPSLQCKELCTFSSHPYTSNSGTLQSNLQESTSPPAIPTIADVPESQDHVSTPPSNFESNQETKIASENAVTLPWPSPFKIPTHKFRKALKEALDTEKVLNKTLKQYLLDTLYDEITKYTFYPSPMQYQDVAESLLQGYPYLRFGLEHVEALTFWKTILSNKMRNGRKRVAKDEPVVAQRKRRWTCTQGNLHGGSNFNSDCTWELMDFILPHSVGDAGEAEDDVKNERPAHKPRKSVNSHINKKGV